MSKLYVYILALVSVALMMIGSSFTGALGTIKLITGIAACTGWFIGIVLAIIARKRGHNA